jgi:plasmid maintenance system antidote protein VapI
LPGATFLVPLSISAHQQALTLRLSRYFGTTAKFWLNLQSSYELEVAEDQLGKAVMREVLPHSIHSPRLI